MERKRNAEAKKSRNTVRNLPVPDTTYNFSTSSVASDSDAPERRLPKPGGRRHSSAQDEHPIQGDGEGEDAGYDIYGHGEDGQPIEGPDEDDEEDSVDAQRARGGVVGAIANAPGVNHPTVFHPHRRRRRWQAPKTAPNTLNAWSRSLKRINEYLNENPLQIGDPRLPGFIRETDAYLGRLTIIHLETEQQEREREENKKKEREVDERYNHLLALLTSLTRK